MGMGRKYNKTNLKKMEDSVISVLKKENWRKGAENQKGVLDLEALGLDKYTEGNEIWEK